MIILMRILRFIEDQHTRKTFLFSSQVHPSYMEAPNRQCKLDCECKSAQRLSKSNSTSSLNRIQDFADGCCEKAFYKAIDF